jgi:hypothetical protein
VAFCNKFIFCTQESLAFIFEMAHLHEDALREYDELELCYLETGAQHLIFFCFCCQDDVWIDRIVLKRLYATLDIVLDRVIFE